MGRGFALCLSRRYARLLGESATARRHRNEFLELLAPKRKFDGPLAQRIRKYVRAKVLPLSAHSWYWQRAMRWIKEYGQFATTLLRSEEEAGRQGGRSDLRLILGDEEMLELFVSALTLDGVGFSVPRSARRFLSAARMRIGHRSLNEIKSLSDVIRGHERTTPRTVMQAESLESDDVERIADAYGCAKSWWLVQVACMISLCFIAILRLGELVAFNMDDVVIVLNDGREFRVADSSPVPRKREVKGVFLHVKWRKAGQAHDVWVPVSCPTSVGLLLRHLRLLRASGRTAGPLFPARVGRLAPSRHASNHVSTTSVRNALRKALVEVCGLTPDQAKLFSGHSMRVGGSNFMRKLGVADEVHRLMGGWASLASSRGYFQLPVTEQFEITHKFALKERVPPKVEGARMASLQSVRLMAVSGG